MKYQTFVVYWLKTGVEICDVEAISASRAIAFVAEKINAYESSLGAW